MSRHEADFTSVKSAVPYVEEAVQKLVQAYISSNQVSSDSVASLNKEVFQKADKAYRESRGLRRPSFNNVRSDFISFLNIQDVPQVEVRHEDQVHFEPVSADVDDSVQVEVNRKPVRRGRPRRARPMLNGHELPRGLSSPDNAISMKHIICFEDGKKVKDLASHLKTLGMTPDEYRVKWGLPDSYPMYAPQFILRRGATYDVDYLTGIRRRVRT